MCELGLNVLLIDHAVLIHAGVNSCHFIIGRPRYQTESANELIFNDVFVRSPPRIGTLPFEYSEMISAVGFGLALPYALPGGLSEALGTSGSSHFANTTHHDGQAYSSGGVRT